ELGRVPELTARCLALSTSWLGAALCTQGWAAVQQGDVEAGIAKMKKGLTFFERAGVHGTYDYHRSALIEAHLTRGATDEALPIVRDALARCQTLLDCFHQAELHRLEGELLRRRGDEAGAETAFRAGSRRRAVSTTFQPCASKASCSKRAWKRRVASWKVAAASGSAAATESGKRCTRSTCFACSPAARMTAASTAFSSCRTLPGHSADSAARSALGESASRGRPCRRHACAQK